MSAGVYALSRLDAVHAWRMRGKNELRLHCSQDDIRSCRRRLLQVRGKAGLRKRPLVSIAPGVDLPGSLRCLQLIMSGKELVRDLPWTQPTRGAPRVRCAHGLRQVVNPNILSSRSGRVIFSLSKHCGRSSQSTGTNCAGNLTTMLRSV